MKNINTEIFEKLFEAVDNAKSKKDIKDILVEIFTHQYKTLKPRNKLSPFAPELNKTKIFSKIKQTALELAPSEESLLYVFDLFKRADGTTAFKGRIIDKRLLLARQMSGEHYAFDIDANKFFKIEPLSRENN